MAVTVRHPRRAIGPRAQARSRRLAPMDPLGIGIVGTGNIAGGYARDIPTHPSIRLVAATDLDPERAAAFGAAHGCRIHALARRPARRSRGRHRRQPHGAHRPLRGHAARPRGREARVQREADGARARRGRELIAIAGRHGVRLGCAPATFLGEAQQTAAAWIRDDAARHDPRGLRRREPRPHRDLAPVARGVLRRRRPGRRRRLPADPGHDDGRAARRRSGRGAGT